MSARAQRPKNDDVGSFRTRLLIAMMIVVAAMTTLGLFLAQRKVAIEAERDLLQDFHNELATLHGVQEMRQAALAERCRDLVKRPRIHAALEDNALDLLYPSARGELRDLVEREGGRPLQTPAEELHAKFYRFLDSHGAVISPPNPAEVGELRPEEEAQLRFPGAPEDKQVGYLLRSSVAGARDVVDEVIALPIFSTESGEVIAMLALGFKPVELGRGQRGTDLKSGLWVGGRLYSAALDEAGQIAFGAEVPKAVASPDDPLNSNEVKINGAPHLLFYKQLNPGSLFAPAYEIALYPLKDAMARQQQIRRHVLMAGGLPLIGGLLASHLVATRLSMPVEKLAVASEQDRALRQRFQAELETTSEELQRSARFSADASHQLKTPVTVLRAGIEGLLAREDFPTEVYDELSALLHQTYRITNVVDDLLLLSRMDAGRLQIQFDTVNLSRLIEEWIDDLSALPDALHVELKTNFPPDLCVSGEKRYIALIVQNLLENARKYNVPRGTICVAVREEAGYAILSVENTGRPIPPAARAHIFERRFHRGAIGENVPGHGLGLNLARELAKLHGGQLRLVRSDEEWTEFEVRFRVARQAMRAASHSA